MGWPDNNMLEAAWGIIANVGGGDWTTQHPDWQAAAAVWREAYHRTLPSLPAPEALADAGREGSVGE